ncbi:MAG: hypothetical protein ACYC66_02465 [Chloroflexota bacterium]
MTRRRKLALAAALVAISALLLVGTSYAGSLVSQEPKEADPAAGCGNAAMGNMHSTMWASLAQSLGLAPEHIASMGGTADSMHGGTSAGQDMGVMHESMHGSDKAAGGSCHGDETGGSTTGGGMGSSGRSMMGQQL